MRGPEDALRDQERLLPHVFRIRGDRLKLLLRVDLDGVEDGVVVEAALGVTAVPGQIQILPHILCVEIQIFPLLYLPLCRI